MMKADGALDKARKHKKRQLEDTLHLVMKKRKEYEEKMIEKGETPVMFSHLGPPRRRTTAEEEEKVKHPKPEDSVYYHPTLNPTGAPPPGKPPMYKSSIGPRIPLSTSSSAAASTSKSESEEAPLAVPPPPPPPPPLPDSDQLAFNDSTVPSSLPPPATIPSKLASDSSTSVPLLSIPPPPPGPPPKENIGVHPLMPPPPPPPIQQSIQSTQEKVERQDTQNGVPDNKGVGGPGQVVTVLPPPPPPPGLPPKQQSGAIKPESSANNVLETTDVAKMIPPPPPRQPPPGLIRFPLNPTLQPDVLPPGVSHIPPPPPLDMRPPPPPPIPGIPGRPLPPGMLAPLLPRPPFTAPHGPVPMFRLPVAPGHPINQEDDTTIKPQKPSYVKSAASTVVKRPLAQHNPELTSMVPASVRVRRETALPRAKPKTHLPPANTGARASAPAAFLKSESGTLAGPKPQSIDDSYMAFLEDMKALGALDG